MSMKSQLSSCITSLPPELLVEIYIWCAVNDSLAPLTIQSVSKWWRTLVTSSARVWQHVVLDGRVHSLSFLRAQTALWVERSEPMPMDVELYITTPDDILPILSPLLFHIRRWRSFTMQDQQERLSLQDVNSSGGHLTDLRISIQDDPVRMHRPTFTAFEQRFSMQVNILHLPKSRSLVPLRITNLKLSEEGSYLHCEPRKILDLLAACPDLQVFSFKGWYHNENPSTGPFPIAYLPSLHTLQLKSTCMTRAILSHLNTPRLVNLYLAQLNAEFQLRGDYNDEGDSEDEAHDFSQSPSTDRATGMGLRILISRCNPPIQLLDMDYSDLRTKDFRFIFERLPLLQDFRIVASDMSNTVIGLLSPYTLPEGQTPQIRLRHLQSLCLQNCNRLSGDAIVNALTARINYINEHPALIEALTNVAIITCYMVRFEHGEKLMELLGSRLQLQTS